MKERLVELDLLRGFAMLGVIGIHASVIVLPLYTSFDPNQPGVVFVNQLFRYATPLLLILSGITLTLAQLHRPLPMLQFYKRRFSRILIPYLLWSIGFTFYYHAQMSGNVIPKVMSVLTIIRQSFSNILTGSADYHMYFVLLLIQLYLLFPALFWLVGRVRQTHWQRFAAGCVVAQTALLFWYMNARQNNAGPNEAFAFRFFGFWIAYFLLGMLLAYYWPEIQALLRRTTIWLLAGFMLAVAVTLTWETGWYAQYPYYDALNFFRPSVMGYVLIAGLALAKIALVIKDRSHLLLRGTNQILSYLGKESLPVYFMHTLVLAKLSQDSHIGSSGGVAAVIFLTIGTVVISLLVTVLFKRFVRLLPRFMKQPYVSPT